MSYLVTKEQISKYSNEFFVDCTICGSDTKTITNDGLPLCIECICSIYSDPKDEPLVKDQELRLSKIMEKAELTIKDIRESVTRHYNVSNESIESKTRKREIVLARQMCMVVAKLKTKKSLSAIGREIGKKDHATVLHAIKTVKNQFDTNRQFKEEVTEILENFNALEKFISMPTPK